MLREFDLQRMHWADKTQSMLHQRQMEACETRLLSYPTESIFTLQDERETECWWQCSYDAEESPKSPVLHTLREMRANVLARLPVEAALLTETEHALIVRLILCEGQARIDGWQELSAAESLLRYLQLPMALSERRYRRNRFVRYDRRPVRAGSASPRLHPKGTSSRFALRAPRRFAPRNDKRCLPF